VHTYAHGSWPFGIHGHFQPTCNLDIPEGVHECPGQGGLGRQSAKPSSPVGIVGVGVWLRSAAASLLPFRVWATSHQTTFRYTKHTLSEFWWCAGTVRTSCPYKEPRARARMRARIPHPRATPKCDPRHTNLSLTWSLRVCIIELSAGSGTRKGAAPGTEKRERGRWKNGHRLRQSPSPRAAGAA